VSQPGRDDCLFAAAHSRGVKSPGEAATAAGEARSTLRTYSCKGARAATAVCKTVRMMSSAKRPSRLVRNRELASICFSSRSCLSEWLLVSCRRGSSRYAQVPVIRVSPELKSFGQQAIKSLPEIDSVSCQEDPADFHTQHGQTSLPRSDYSVTRLMLIRQNPTRSSRPPSGDEEHADAAGRSTTDSTCGAVVTAPPAPAAALHDLVWVHETPQALPMAPADPPASKAARYCRRRPIGIRRPGPCARRNAEKAAARASIRLSLATSDGLCGFDRRMA